MLPTKLADMATAEGGRVKYWVLSDDPHFQVGGEPPEGVNWATLPDGFSEAPGATKESCSLYILVKQIPARGERPTIRYVIAIDSTPYMGTLEEFTRTLLLITALGVMLVALLGFMIAFRHAPCQYHERAGYKLPRRSWSAA
jgi:two-component system heavy metal sensor histidine kinase CusS